MRISVFWVNFNLRLSIQEDDQNGTANITVSITDSTGVETIESFLLTIDNVNDLPILSLIPSDSDLNVDEDGDSYIIPMSVFDIDITTNAHVMSYSAISSVESLISVNVISVSDSGDSADLVIDLLDNQHGTANISVTVDDSFGGSDTVSFVVTVNPLIDSPYFTQMLVFLKLSLMRIQIRILFQYQLMILI